MQRIGSFLLLILLVSGIASAQAPPYDVFPVAKPPYYRVRYEASEKDGELKFGVNYTIWIPPGVQRLRGVVVHQHGCGEGSCKSGLTGAFDLHWQALARKHGCALLAPSYEQPQGADCQLWCDPRNGSADAFRQGLQDLAKKSGHPELSSVPWALWGHSGGGHWAGGMVLLYPERVAAAWLRSGVPLLKANPDRPKIKPHQVPEAALRVPIMCNPGTKEGVTVKDGRFARVWPANEVFFHGMRSRGSLIGVAVDPLTAHECGNQRYMAIQWLDACLALRLPAKVGQALKTMPTSDIWLAPITGFEAVKASDHSDDPLKASWLPNERTARAWMQYVKDTKVSDKTPPPAPTNVQVKDGRVTWQAEADIESGLAHFIIERDGKFLARVPENGKNRFGRPIFQNLQYSDTPTQPLVPMRYTDKTASKNEQHVYRVIAVNTVGLKSKPSNTNSKKNVSARRNVLLIAVDDLNDWVGCLGGHPQAKTPAIDKLAGQGTLFSNAHCQSPVCNPSRASLLTGRYPFATGIYFLAPGYNRAPALNGVRTLPERFADDGYHVMGVGKIFHNRGNQVFRRIGEYGGPMGGFGPRPKKKISQPHGHPLWDWGAFPERDDQMPDFKVANWAIERLKKKYDKPFFMAVGFWRPHVPMFAPKKWFDMHPRDKIQLPKVRADDLDDISSYAWDLTNLKHVSPKHDWVKEAKQWEHAVQSYLASTSFVDHQIGRVMAALNSSEHKDNTTIVLFADHGFHLGEKERWAKRTLWEDGTRVPLIVVDPAYRGDQVCSRPAELIDIFPTLLDLVGAKPDSSQQGQSLVPLLRNPTAEWNHPALTSFGPGNHSVRTTRYRFIRYHDGSEEFYDHQSDPHEWSNLLASKSPSDQLKKLVARHRAMLPTKEHRLLPGSSTGHQAFAAAEANRKEQR